MREQITEDVETVDGVTGARLKQPAAGPIKRRQLRRSHGEGIAFLCRDGVSDNDPLLTLWSGMVRLLREAKTLSTKTKMVF